VLVTIDQQSSERIALPADPQARDRCLDLKLGEAPASHERLPPPHLVMRWPRCLHGLAVRALAAAGARVIALDISFRPLSALGSDNSSRSEDEQDRVLANAIESAGNVLLAPRLDPIEVSRQRITANSLRAGSISPPTALPHWRRSPASLGLVEGSRARRVQQEEVRPPLPAPVFICPPRSTGFRPPARGTIPTTPNCCRERRSSWSNWKPLLTSLAIRYPVRADLKVPASPRVARRPPEHGGAGDTAQLYAP
jgi:hypothetical protein